MNYFKLLCTRQMLVPISALAFASAVSVAAVAARIIWAGNLQYAFLIWNLFLAWMPLFFAILACGCAARGFARTWRLAVFAGGWLFFFPNAPYIFTDLVHLKARFAGNYWIDLLLILMCAFTGLVIGFMSLYVMQGTVTRLYGRVKGWLFSAAAIGLGSVGIYLGRFLRFNSWDILRPWELYEGIVRWVSTHGFHRPSIAFLLLCTAFLFISYVTLYALTCLSPAPAAMEAQMEPEPR